MLSAWCFSTSEKGWLLLSGRCQACNKGSTFLPFELSNVRRLWPITPCDVPPVCCWVERINADFNLLSYYTALCNLTWKGDITRDIHGFSTHVLRWPVQYWQCNPIIHRNLYFREYPLGFRGDELRSLKKSINKTGHCCNEGVAYRKIIVKPISVDHCHRGYLGLATAG